ncbi:MAG: hypothetical protein SWH68_10700 [Thermodesulfobacteriota bacterium]|nr:hypothetical protein [Thermodesulfobacteriota bacterium]
MFLKKNLHYFMVAAIVIGLLNVYVWGGVSIPKSVLIFIMIAFVIFPVMLNTRFEQIFAHFREPRPIFCSLVLNFIISPLAAFIIGRIFLADQPFLFVGLMLIALIPTSSMSIAWTAFAEAKVATALYLTPLNILFAAFVGLPVIFPLLLKGDMIAIDKVLVMKNILMVFFLPLILGSIARQGLIRWKGNDFFQQRIKPNAGTVAAAGILVMILLVMSQQRNTVLLNNYSVFIVGIVPVVLYYIVMYTASILWTKFLIDRGVLAGEVAVVLIYTSAARHINLSIAIALSTFAVEHVSLIMIVLIMAYLVQVPGLAFFAQKYGKLFVKSAGDGAPTAG